MKKLIIPLLFFFIFFIPLIQAQPPFVQTGGEVFVEGLEIRFPPVRIVKVGQAVTANFHVYNLSNGFPVTNKSASCYLDIYNSTGGHLLNNQITRFGHQFDFEIDIESGNFSEPGLIAVIIQCNTSTTGGYASFGVDVTYDGLPINYYPFYMILFLVVAWILFLVSCLKDGRYSEFLAFFSGIMFIVFGVQIAAGMLGIQNFLTNTLSVIHLGLGMWIIVASGLDMIQGSISRTGEYY